MIVKLLPALLVSFRQQFAKLQMCQTNLKHELLTQIVSWGHKDICHENKDGPGSHRIRKRHLCITTWQVPAPVGTTEHLSNLTATQPDRKIRGVWTIKNCRDLSWHDYVREERSTDRHSTHLPNDVVTLTGSFLVSIRALASASSVPPDTVRNRTTHRKFVVCPPTTGDCGPPGEFLPLGVV